MNTKVCEQTEYPQQLIWDQVRVERDWLLMSDAMRDLENCHKNPERVANRKAYETFVDDSLGDFIDAGIKTGEKGKLFVPRRVVTNLDGNIRHARFGVDIALVIPFLDIDDKWHIIAVECLAVRTKRGRGFVCLADNPAGWRNKHFYHKSDAIWFIRDHAIRRCVDRSPIKCYEAALGTILWALLKAKRREGLATRLVGSSFILNGESRKGYNEIKASNAIYEGFGNIVGTRFVVYGLCKARSDAERKALVLIHTWLSQDMQTTPRDLSRTANDKFLTIQERSFQNHAQNLDGHCTSCGNFTCGSVNVNAANLKCGFCGRKTLHGMEALREQGVVIFTDSVHAQYAKKFGD
jgi:hypothetical protein